MILSFGKYRDETAEWVLEHDRRYVEWMLTQTSLMPEFIEAQTFFRKLLGREKDTQQKKERERLPWWDVLEVSPEANIEAIKRAYRKQMSLYHPDKTSGLGVELQKLAGTMAQEINIAYDAAVKARGG